MPPEAAADKLLLQAWIRSMGCLPGWDYGPAYLLPQQFVDLIVQLADAVLPQAGVLDLGHLAGDLLEAVGELRLFQDPGVGGKQISTHHHQGAVGGYSLLGVVLRSQKLEAFIASCRKIRSHQGSQHSQGRSTWQRNC